MLEELEEFRKLTWEVNKTASYEISLETMRNRNAAIIKTF